MDRVCIFTGVSHHQFNTGDIVEVDLGGDDNRHLKPDLTDAEWEELKNDRLDTLRRNALSRGLKESEIEVKWIDSSGTHQADWMAQLEAYGQSLLTHADKRKVEYPDIGDQLDALYHAGVFPADMEAQLKAVKDKYAKE